MQQRIVFNGNIMALLSSISWITAHGYLDGGNQDTLEFEALERKLVFTCGPAVYFTFCILSEKGIKSRIVSTFSLDPFNKNYDDGHAMLEIYFPDSKKWILFDIDQGTYFSYKGRALNLLEAYDAVKTGDYELIPLCNSIKIDVNSSDLFFLVHIRNDVKNWYKHIFQVVHMNNYYFLDDNLENRENLKKRMDNNEIAETPLIINKEEFQQIYYSGKF